VLRVSHLGILLESGTHLCLRVEHEDEGRQHNDEPKGVKEKHLLKHLLASCNAGIDSIVNARPSQS
jgi:hypothetical protein